LQLALVVTTIFLISLTAGPIAQPELQSSLDPESVQRLIDDLHHNDSARRSAAASALADGGRNALVAVPALRHCLKDPKPFVRAMAARTLLQIAPEINNETIPCLIGLLTAKDIGSRCWGSGLLVSTGESAVPYLAASFKHGDGELRKEVVATFWALGAAETVPAKVVIPELIKGLKDSDAQVRGEAAKWLGWMGSEAEAARPAIELLLSDESQQVREKAASALKMLRP